MLWQMKAAILELLWEATWTTKLYSWALVLSSCFLLGQLLGSGIQGITETAKTSPTVSTKLNRDLPKWKQDTTATVLKSSTSSVH